ncbi:MAG: UDP-N-acetylmuramoyl-L-alanine--D-glutamate ligase [Lachnospiraceae bacterium]|nr:UDP-N-acetylmuramoyl-L-alanine--D-glutamate ligase [Lachnospiraceae bacterium]
MGNLSFEHKDILVCGMAKSGVSAAKLLNNMGANVTLSDIKPEAEFEKEVLDLKEEGIKLYCGKNPDDIIDGFDYVVLSPGIDKSLPFVKKAEELHIPIIGEIELGYIFTPCNIIGITGTNGKTTTTALTGEIFKTEYPGTQVVGNIGVPYCGKVMELNYNDWVVAELSSFQLESIIDFKPKISAVLNITPDHLNRHKTMENYIAAKENIFKNQLYEDFTVLNYECEYCRAMEKKTRARVMFFSSKRKLDAGIYIEDDNIIVKWNGINEKLINVNELNILGEHNYENAMAASCMALCAGISLENIRKTLRSFVAVEHRIEFVRSFEGVDYYNDSKGTNPDAAIKAVKAMRKPVVLIGGGYDKKSDYTEWILSFENKVKSLVLIGETAKEIEKTARENGFNSVKNANSFEEAILMAKEDAKEGDCVLLSPACASWDMFKNYEERGRIFKEFVRSFK